MLPPSCNTCHAQAGEVHLDWCERSFENHTLGRSSGLSNRSTLALAELTELSEDMERQLESGIHDPATDYAKVVRLVKRLNRLQS